MPAPPDSPGRQPDPAGIATRQDFARELNLAKELAGLTVRDLAKAAGVPGSTVGGYLSGRHLPPLKPPGLLADLLRSCGVTDPRQLEEWSQALRRVRRTPGPARSDAPAPYRGLASFQPEHADWFFGREEPTRALTARVESGTGVMALVGPSGVGKSSLLRAGLIPSLDRPWRLITPGVHPLAEIAEPMPEGSVLVVDQFEEVFTVCADDERQAFISALCEMNGVTVVLGLRADFYPHALGNRALAGVLDGSQVIVGPMSEAELSRAILEPARKARLDVEDGLVDLVLRDLAPATDANAGALPLLSHALLATWQRGQRKKLTAAHYRESGGISGAVAQTAEAAFAALDARRRRLAEHLFLRLVRVSTDAADTRRRVSRAELLHGSTELESVVDEFIEQRLITADLDTLEISHEALIHAWPRLRAWIDADRTGRIVAQQLADAADAWEREHRDPAVLYRGTRLAAAREWAGSNHHDELSPLAREFLQTSVRQERLGIRRLRQTIAALVALLLLAVTTGVVALQQRASARRQRNLAISRLVAGRANRVRDKDVSLAAQLSLAAYRIAPTAEARSSLIDSSALPPVTRLLGSTGVMQAVALSSRGLLAAGGADRTVRLWDATVPGVPRPIAPALTGPADIIYSVAFSPDGRILAAGGGDHTVRLWDLTDARHPAALGPPLTGPAALVYSVAFSPDGRTLAAGSGDRSVRLWDVTDAHHPKALARPLSGARSYIQSVTFSPDGRTLAAGSDDHTVRLWDLSDPRHPAALGPPLAGPAKRVYAVAFSPDGRTLAAGGADNLVWLWNVSDRRHPTRLGRPLSGATSWVNALAFGHDASELAVAGSDGLVRLWDVAAHKVTATFQHPGPVTGVVFDTGHSSIITSAADGTVRVWRLPAPVLGTSSDVVSMVTFRPDGHVLLVGAADAQLWSVPALRRLGPAIRNASGFATSIVFAPDGRLFAVGGRDGTVRLWDATDPQRPVPRGPAFRAHSLNIETLAFSPDGRVLATGSDDNSVRLWNVTDPAHPIALAALSGFGSYVYSVAFSPDGLTLAAGSVDKTVRLWSMRDPRRPRQLGAPLTGPDSYVFSVVFSPDGRTLAEGSADRTIRLWNVTDPARPALAGPTLTGPSGYVYALAYAPDGRTLAAADTDESVWLWDVHDRRRPAQLGALTAGTGAMFTVAFARDGRTLAAGGDGKKVWIWDTDPEHVASNVCAGAGDPITPAEWRLYVPGLPYRSPCRR
ncbi:helix-turn-helix domain-containing protein [Actinoallomurus sp. CA-150999]|uniref:nSTAND1 domain-containing NTPase n=1 Tax=Actinoallomurus sp. CA-150999 TaxID=3239887 RepID=UPI003D8C4DFB